MHQTDNNTIPKSKGEVIETGVIHTGDSREVLSGLPDESVHCIVTSPPYYGLRDYGHAEQMGLESTPEEYVSNMVSLFAECRRVLKKDGTLWLNIGDSYAGGGGASGHTEHTKNLGVNTSIYGAVKSAGKTYGLKPKDLIGIPWMLAFALRADGWYLRQDIIWHKPNPMPESVTDRCTKAHEYIFLFSKSQRYYYDAGAIKEPCVTPSDSKAGHKFGGNKNNVANSLTCHSNQPGKEWVYSETANKRSVWTVTTKPFAEAHFATFPEEIPTLCIKAGCPENGIVLDPFAGAGTTALVAAKLNRKYIGIELNPSYVAIAEKRLQKELGMFYKV